MKKVIMDKFTKTGAFEPISEFERDMYGYDYDCKYVTFIYSRHDRLYWFDGKDYRVLYNYMIKKRYTIQEAKIKFPELLL